MSLTKNKTEKILSFLPDDERSEIISRLRDDERLLLSLRLYRGLPYAEIAELLGKSEKAVYNRIYRISKKIHKLLHEDIKISLEVCEVIEQVKNLNPFIIKYLQRNNIDLKKLPWNIFEHLIAEFFASWGYENVTLVGRNPYTAADIIAMRKDDKSGVTTRYFIEVKRWKKRVDAQIIDRVIGAIANERPKYGWHIGMIVSMSGFTKMHKYNYNEISMLGIELRDNEHINKWLSEYEFSRQGLWLPQPVVKDVLLEI